MGFSWDVLITGLSTLFAGLGGAWINGATGVNRDKQAGRLGVQLERDQRQRDAYATLIMVARQVLRNQRQMLVAYVANEPGFSGDPIVADTFTRANTLGDDLTRAVVEVELLGSEVARTNAVAILEAVRAVGDIFAARSLALHTAEKSDKSIARLPPFDESAATARCQTLDASIGAFIDAVRPETHAVSVG